jgi:hypothetical protein
MKSNKLKTTILTAIIAVVIVVSITPAMQSCKKTSTASMSLYDSLGGTALVDDPSHPGTKIEQGRLGIRSVVDSTIFVIAADTGTQWSFYRPVI